MSTIIEKLEQRQPATPSRWREKAEFRQAHKKLLRTLQRQQILLLDKIEKDKAYFDYEAFARDLFIDDYYFTDGYVFRRC